MKKFKLIRIDETPRRILGNPIKILIDNHSGFFSDGALGDNITSLLTGNQSKGQNPPFLKGGGDNERGYPFFSNGLNPRFFYPDNTPSNLDLPSYLMEQIIRTNGLILEFNTGLEQRRMPKERIDEFQYDSFKIGLRITEGILLQFNRPWLASRQFDLAKIHVENTLITLENFEEDRIGFSQKIRRLKENCQKLIPIIQEFKEYFELDQI